jgi:hypothetical protein
MERPDSDLRVSIPYRQAEATVTMLSSQSEINHEPQRIDASIQERTCLLLGRFGRRLKRERSLPV